MSHGRPATCAAPEPAEDQRRACVAGELDEEFVVAQPDAVADPRAVVVHAQEAALAGLAVVGARSTHDVAPIFILDKNSC